MARKLFALPGPATTEDIRVALVKRGETDLAKQFELWRDERRAMAHPPGDIRPLVLAALGTPL